MFQIIEPPLDPKAAADKLVDLRREMKVADVDAYLIPRADAHQGEYVAPPSERLKWLTGFSGSAGVAVVTKRGAALFVDGRYTVQAKLQTDNTLFSYPGFARTEMVKWLTAALKPGNTLGFDPWLITIAEFVRLDAALRPLKIKLKPLGRNLVDKIWGADRPKPESLPIELHSAKFAGEAVDAKLARVQAKLKDADQDYAILTQTDSIAWLLNIRGQDIPHIPIALAFAIVPRAGKAELFIDPQKVPASIKSELRRHVKFDQPAKLRTRLKDRKTKGQIARLDPATAAYWFHRTLGSTRAYKAGADPCIALKAIKNEIEIAGSRSAHERDGVAVVRFLSWLDDIAGAKNDKLDELRVVKTLEQFRRDTGALQEISFDTIAGSGPNGAIVHYRVDEHSNRTHKNGELLLVDSGAQYRDGTTDITRTIAIGKPSSRMRRDYTLVLKGHVAISRAVFPVGTRGADLDPLARAALWRHGLDYDHGTGHGVGSYLSVHEGPQSISRAGMVALAPGMILSNEPGYYKEGAYGIRTENLVLVSEPERPKGGDRDMLSFETLTLAPYDRHLIDPELLEPDEVDWINSYHDRVHRTLSGNLPADARRWLKEATRPL